MDAHHTRTSPARFPLPLIRFVMKAGRLFNANFLDQAWSGSRPYGAHPWVQPEALRHDDRGVDYWDQGR